MFKPPLPSEPPILPEIKYTSLEQVLVIGDKELSSRIESWENALEIDVDIADAQY